MDYEKWNGTGYPYELNGEDIPLSARVVCIADVYDALRTKRPYKEPMNHKETINLILKDSGTHFNPKIIDVLKTNRYEFAKIFKQFDKPLR